MQKKIKHRFVETDKSKQFNSEEYNFYFNKEDGFFARWGKTLNDDPDYSPAGPELYDVEISTICHKKCRWCYKSNTDKGKNMSFDTFKKMFDKFPKIDGKVVVQQIAFGIGSISANPDLWKIMQYCRDNGVIPNITINGEGMNDKYYRKLSELCGAVAISHYDSNKTFNAVKKLTDLGMKQVNIHALLSAETFDKCMDLITKDVKDPRLKDMYAIVFLWLKPKGERNTFHQVNVERDFKKLIETAIAKKITFGFDSCSGPVVMNILKKVLRPADFCRYEKNIEPCESSIFSYYINVDGVGFPCSFTEGEPGFPGIDVVGCDDFLKDVWYHPDTVKFRNKLIDNKDKNKCRVCQVFEIGE